MWQLAVFRILLGLGMGGEWASGAALVSETWPAEHRGKALGFMQSAWAIGYAAAALVTWIVMPLWGWRAVFFVGVLPALFTLWVRRDVKEPEIWTAAADGAAVRRPHARFADIFTGGWLPLTVAVTLMNACTMFAWWGFNLGSRLPVAAGQRGRRRSEHGRDVRVRGRHAGRHVVRLRDLRLHQRCLGRKRTYVIYLPSAAVLSSSTARRRTRSRCCCSGRSWRSSATGYFSGFGAVTAEIYPTHPRDRAGIHLQHRPRRERGRAVRRGFTGRDARLWRGALGRVARLPGGCGGWIWIPETKGRELAL